MEKEKQLIVGSFRDYYKNTRIEVPAVEQREFGVGGFKKKIESRHMGFVSDLALNNYLVSEPPLYISHSIAYYKYPEATPMENKDWMGGGLIFDLDVHAGMFLSGEEIEQVTNDAISLEEILVAEFGVAKEEILRVFSGGRGYHLHITSSKFRKLEGDERREISDYMSGVGIRFENFFDQVDRYRLEGPKLCDWGYRGRFCRIIEKTLASEPGKIHRGLARDEAGRNKIISCMEDGNWSKSPIKDIKERAIKIAQEKMKLSTVDVDTGVTIDTKRLIRVPNTIHGSTGLVAKKLDKFEGFEPYRDALAFGSEALKIKAEVDLASQEFANSTMEKMKKGEEKEVPKSYGMYLLLKEAATLC